MNLTMIPQKFAATTLVILAGFLVLLPTLSAQTDDSPTACVGADMDDLRAAMKADPSNIGIRMRVVRLILEEMPQTDNRRRRKAMLEELEAQLAEIKKLGPEFTYVYRVLARQHERKKEFEKVVEVLEDYSKIADLDYDMRNTKVRALLRMGDSKENPLPEKTQEAADYVANWFSSGTAPVFAETLAATQTWMIDPGFRKALIGCYAKMYKATPKNINLIISYASALYVAGRYESAWKVMRDAEKIGLCDDVMGGRHPLILFLEWRCPEDQDTAAFGGLDLDELRTRSTADAGDLSLTYRLAVRLKAKAYTGERIVSNMKKGIADLETELDDAIGADSAKRKEAIRTKISRIKESVTKITGQVAESYKEALPLALKVRESNGQIDSVALLLADINNKLGDMDSSIRYIKESIKRVPFFVPLRDKLAGIYAEKKAWKEAAEALVGSCRLVPCQAEIWDDEDDTKLPVVSSGREKLIVAMAQDPKARGELTKAFEAAVAKDPRNPNLQCFTSMAYFFAGNKSKAAEWMRKAESLGVCGRAGSEHTLATFIYTRENW
ncbi:MAG: tetratricopeptide (TPR) repeat protein [Planctomycetota bacterium]|jgi:tetratricopeptide (TPR) repeat protein